MIRIRVYRSINEINTSKEYLKGHIQVLRDYGITNITSNNNEWMHNPDMYCVIATDDDEMVGGIRVQVANGIFNLPVEDAIGKIDKRIYDLVNKYRKEGGIGELCGLWNSKKVQKMGVSTILVRAAISMTNQLNFTTLTGICSDYSMPMFSNVGFVVNKDLGENGDFLYPNKSTIARVVGLLNVKSLRTAHSFDKSRMKNLRKNPIQLTVEEGPKGEIIIDYNLIIKKINILRTTGKSTFRNEKIRV